MIVAVIMNIVKMIYADFKKYFKLSPNLVLNCSQNQNKFEDTSSSFSRINISINLSMPNKATRYK